MQISQFARATGLSADTVRFYVRKGLIAPETGCKGGSNPYQVFTPAHVETARVIRLAQSLGFSLRDIAAFGAELHAGAMSADRVVEILRAQTEALEAKAAGLDRMIAYMRAKISWLEAGAQGPEPRVAAAADELSARLNKTLDGAYCPTCPMPDLPSPS